MKPLAILAAGACALAIAANCDAIQLTSPTIFGGFFQQTAQCTIGNVGSTPVSVTVNIVDEAGNVVPTDTHCGVVEPHFLCQVSARNIPTNAAFACTATTSRGAAQLRGNLAIIDFGEPIRSAELR
jgi:hypothetical protein